MGFVPNNQSFAVSSSGSIAALRGEFETNIDSVLVDLGRDITVHLSPGKSACTSPNCKFNSTYKRYMGINGKICEECKGQGFFIEPRYTIYRANIRWTNEPFNESSRNIQEVFEPGRLGANFCRIKTKAVSMDHIRESVGATIDGVNVELYREPRHTGFGPSPLLYVVSWWKVMNR